MWTNFRVTIAAVQIKKLLKIMCVSADSAVQHVQRMRLILSTSACLALLYFFHIIA